MFRARRHLVGRVAATVAVVAGSLAVPVSASQRVSANAIAGQAAQVTRAAHRLEVPATWPPDLPGCWPEGNSAVADKAAQRFWLCSDGVPVTDSLPMTTASVRYGLPPVGDYPVASKRPISSGIGGEILHDFTTFYVTPRGNNIGFHRVVNQDPSTLGDADQRGASSGCFRVRADHAVMIFEFLDVGDRVVVLTP